MAAFSLVEECPEDISCICGLVEPEVEGILLRYDDFDRKDLERELASECDKQMLLHARGKIFDLVKAKVLRCLSTEEAAKLLGDAPTDDKDECTALLSSYVGQWELTPRRVEHRISFDIMEMLAFVLGTEVSFPSKLIKESSLSRGSHTNAGNADNDTSLLKQLEKDISCATGPADIETVSKKDGSHVLSVSFRVDADAEPGEKDTAQVNVPEVSKAVSAEIEGSALTTAICTCKCHLSKKGQDKASNTIEPIKVVEKHDMATQTGEEVITRTEFEYQSEYVEEKCSENARDIKEIGKWRSNMQDRIRRVEVVQKKEIAELKKQQKAMSEAIDNLEKRKEKESTAKGGVGSRPEGVSQTDQGGGRHDSDGESVWDFPMEQSTPPKEKRGGEGPKGTKRSDATQRKQSTSVLNAHKDNVPQSSSAASGAAVKVGIEIIDDESTEPGSSSNTDCSSPQPKKMKYDGNRGKANRGGSRGGRGRGRGVARIPLAATIEEEPRVGARNQKDTNTSWSEMDDGSYYGVLEDEAAADSEPSSKKGGTSNADKGDDTRKGRDKSGGDSQPVKTNVQKGESSTTINNKPDSDQTGESDSDRSTYAEMAGEEPWLPAVRPKKNADNKFRSLKGVKATVHREVYVQGLDLQGASDYTEMESLINKYCKKNGVKVVFLNIIPVKYDKNQVGCKLSVLSEDYERVLNDDFWPEFVTVRAWRYRNRDAPNAGVREGNDQ